MDEPLDVDRRHAAALAVSATAYAVCHHLGLLPGGLGAAPDGTQWADWLDLLVPFVVLGPAVWTAWLGRSRLSRGWWVALGVGVVLYASGHGIHLSANSIGNVDPGPTAHLWDETVGHLVWYAGVAVVAAVLARTAVGRPRPPAWGLLPALAAGLTWASNALGSGLVVPMLLVALAAAGWGWVHRRGLGVAWLVAGASAVVWLVAVLVLG